MKITIAAFGLGSFCLYTQPTSQTVYFEEVRHVSQTLIMACCDLKALMRFEKNVFNVFSQFHFLECLMYLWVSGHRRMEGGCNLLPVVARDNRITSCHRHNVGSDVVGGLSIPPRLHTHPQQSKHLAHITFACSRDLEV